MHDVGDAFTDRTGVEVTFNFASSGALARQIPASSKGDAYLSASEYWMDAVEALLVPGSRMDLLSNQLVLVRHQDSVIREIGGPNMRFLAIGDPAHVPVGSYAREWLRASGLWERVVDRLLLGPDARAVLAQAEGNLDVLAIVYRTDYLARSEGLHVLREVPPGPGWQIRYPAALLRDNENSRAWMRFLTSDHAAEIYAEHGFGSLRQRPRI
jgi:molybdate transport system substrate-binding protein